MTHKHTHLFPVNTEEERLLASKAQSELERDQQFLKHGDTELLGNLDLTNIESIENLSPSDDVILENDSMYNKVLDVSDINELSSLADYLVGKLPSSQTKMGAEEAISTESSQTD